MTRQINAPGTEINEIDRSQYGNNAAASIVGTRAFIMGFADKGEDYKIKLVSSTKDLADSYGQPANEAEKYFYNAAIDILAQGGGALMAKLPYDNESKDKFSYVDYSLRDEDSTIISNGIGSVSLSDEMQQSDQTLTSFMELSCLGYLSSQELLPMESLDEYKINRTALSRGTARIIDITRAKYGKLSICRKSSGTSVMEEDECLGIMPVLVSPLNAMFFQGIISSSTDQASSETSKIKLYNAVSNFKLFAEESCKSFEESNFATKLSSKQTASSQPEQKPFSPSSYVKSPLFFRCYSYIIRIFVNL
jgi:hypothetical protein